MFHFYIIFLVMKLNGIFGKGTGKLGSSVFSVNAGEQVVRQYQSQVANPSTSDQVNSRAAMKLASQLSAALASVIAFRKNGMVSARNAFIKANYGLISVNDGEAEIALTGIQLTAGTRGIPAVTASRNATTSINVALASDASKSVDRVVYVAVAKNAEGNLQVIDSAVVETAGAGGTFAGSLAYSALECVVYAYGIKDASAAASTKYGNYGVTSGTDIARLVGTRSMSSSDFAFTKTVGASLAAL